jgi:CHAD domain-containing protein
MRASSTVFERLSARIEAVTRARQDVIAGAHGEALHDLRVNIRRLRAVLRTLRKPLGRREIDKIRAGFKQATDATNALRDAEVLMPLLNRLAISDPAAQQRQQWLGRLAAEEAEIRASVVEALQAGSLAEPLAELPLRLRSASVAGVKGLGRGRARKATRRERDRVAKLFADGRIRLKDARRMHRLRLACKRLRYIAEFYEPLLPKALRAWAAPAHAIQTALGELHDLDVALERTAAAPELEPDAREEIAAALGEQRASALAAARRALRDARRKINI